MLGANDGPSDAASEGLELLVAVGDGVGSGVTGEVVGENDGLLEWATDGLELLDLVGGDVGLSDGSGVTEVLVSPADGENNVTVDS